MNAQSPGPDESGPVRPPTQPPAPKGRTKAFVLAMLMHGLLVALLFVGIRWKSQEPQSVSAELWTPPPTPQIEPPPEGSVRAGAHEDINVITLLLGAEEGGLEMSE